MKKILNLLIIITLTNGCAPTSTTFLGPAFTGIKTGSTYQAAISYSSGNILNKISEDIKKIKEKKIQQVDKYNQILIENKKKLLTSLSPQKKADTFFKAVEKMKMDGLEILYN